MQLSRITLAMAMLSSSALAQTPFITGQNPGEALRSDFTGFVGMQVTVGNTPLLVNAVGRIYAGGSSAHVVKFVRKTTLTDVPGASAIVAPQSAPFNTYAYATLPAPVVLQANTSYYLVSQELVGGDPWYDYGTVTHTAVASVDGLVYPNAGALTAMLAPNYTFGPPNFQYSTPAPFITGQSSSSVRNNYSGFLGTEIIPGAAPVTISALGRIYLPGNSGTHLLKLLSAGQGSTYTDLATAAITMQPGTANAYQYAALNAPVTLQQGTTYYVVSQETNGGDTFYDWGTVTHTSAAAVGGLVYQVGSSYSTVLSADYAFVPVNFLYSPGDPTKPLTVSAVIGTIAVFPPQPQNNVYPLSGIGVAAVSIATVLGVQPRIDGVTTMPEITKPPFSFNLPPLNYGNHTLTLTARDSAGNVVTSAPVTFTVTLPQGLLRNSGGQLFSYADSTLVSFSPGILRNNFTGFAGFKFLTGPVTGVNASGAGSTYPSFVLNEVGRLCAPGNNQVHELRLINESGGSVVWSAWMNMAGCTPGQFVVAQVPAFSTSTSYYLVSYETAGGDQFYDYSPVAVYPSPVSQTPPAPYLFSIDEPVYFNGVQWQLVAAPGYSYVGLSLGGITTTTYR